MAGVSDIVSLLRNLTQAVGQISTSLGKGTFSLVTVTGAPTITAGTGAPSGTQPNGSLYLRSDGTTGARLYVSTGSTWNAVSGV